MTAVLLATDRTTAFDSAAVALSVETLDAVYVLTTGHVGLAVVVMTAPVELFAFMPTLVTQFTF